MLIDYLSKVLIWKI